MKRKALSILLVMSMLMSMFVPFTAFAEEGGYTFAAYESDTEGNKVALNDAHIKLYYYDPDIGEEITVVEGDGEITVTDDQLTEGTNYTITATKYGYGTHTNYFTHGDEYIPGEYDETDGKYYLSMGKINTWFFYFYTEDSPNLTVYADFFKDNEYSTELEGEFTKSEYGSYYTFTPDEYVPELWVNIWDVADENGVKYTAPGQLHITEEHNSYNVYKTLNYSFAGVDSKTGEEVEFTTSYYNYELNEDQTDWIWVERGTNETSYIQNTYYKVIATPTEDYSEEYDPIEVIFTAGSEPSFPSKNQSTYEYDAEADTYKITFAFDEKIEAVAGTVVIDFYNDEEKPTLVAGNVSKLIGYDDYWDEITEPVSNFDLTSSLTLSDLDHNSSYIIYLTKHERNGANSVIIDTEHITFNLDENGMLETEHSYDEETGESPQPPYGNTYTVNGYAKKDNTFDVTLPYYSFGIMADVLGLNYAPAWKMVNIKTPEDSFLYCDEGSGHGTGRMAEPGTYEVTFFADDQAEGFGIDIYDYIKIPKEPLRITITEDYEIEFGEYPDGIASVSCELDNMGSYSTHILLEPAEKISFEAVIDTENKENIPKYSLIALGTENEYDNAEEPYRTLGEMDLPEDVNTYTKKWELSKYIFIESYEDGVGLAGIEVEENDEYRPLYVYYGNDTATFEEFVFNEEDGKYYYTIPDITNFSIRVLTSEGTIAANETIAVYELDEEGKEPETATQTYTTDEEGYCTLTLSNLKSYAVYVEPADFDAIKLFGTEAGKDPVFEEGVSSDKYGDYYDVHVTLPSKSDAPEGDAQVTINFIDSDNKPLAVSGYFAWCSEDDNTLDAISQIRGKSTWELKNLGDAEYQVFPESCDEPKYVMNIGFIRFYIENGDLKIGDNGIFEDGSGDGATLSNEYYISAIDAETNTITVKALEYALDFESLVPGLGVEIPWKVTKVVDGVEEVVADSTQTTSRGFALAPGNYIFYTLEDETLKDYVTFPEDDDAGIEFTINEDYSISLEERADVELFNIYGGSRTIKRKLEPAQSRTIKAKVETVDGSNFCEGTVVELYVDNKAEYLYSITLPTDVNTYETSWDVSSVRQVISYDYDENGEAIENVSYVENRYSVVGYLPSGDAIDFTYDVSTKTYSATVIGVDTAVYEIAIDSSFEHGTVEANKAYAAQGEKVTLTATPVTEGYSLTSLTVTDADNAVVYQYPAATRGIASNHEFTMPASDVTVSAVFEFTGDYDIIIPEDIAFVSVVANAKTAKENDTVTLTITPEAGFYLVKIDIIDSWGTTHEYTKVNDTTYTFQMPASDVQIIPDIGRTIYTISTTHTGNGTVSVNMQEATVGEFPVITAIPAEGYRLKSVEVTYIDANGETKKIEEFTQSGIYYGFDMPAGNVTVNVEFAENSGSGEDPIPGPGFETPFTVAATLGSATVDVDTADTDVDVHANDTVVVEVKVNGSAFTNADWTMVYDSAKFELTGETLHKDAMKVVSGDNVLAGRLLAPAGKTEGDEYADGTVVATYTFKVLSQQKDEVVGIFGITDAHANTYEMAGDLDNCPAKTENAQVTILLVEEEAPVVPDPDDEVKIPAGEIANVEKTYSALEQAGNPFVLADGFKEADVTYAIVDEKGSEVTDTDNSGSAADELAALDFKTALPTWKDVGTYTYYVKVSGDGLATMYDVATLTIIPRELTPSATFAVDPDINQVTFTPVLEGVVDGSHNGTVTVKYTDAVEGEVTKTLNASDFVYDGESTSVYKGEKITAKAKKSETFTLTLDYIEGVADEATGAKADNYTGGEKTATVEVDKIAAEESTVKALEDTITNEFLYNAQPHTTVIDETKLPTGWSVESITDAYDGTIDPSVTEVGDEKLVKVVFKDGTSVYNDVVVYVILKVNPANVKITIHKQEKSVNEPDPKLTYTLEVIAVDADGNETVLLTDELYSEEDLAKLAIETYRDPGEIAGTYQIHASYVPTPNYKVEIIENVLEIDAPDISEDDEPGSENAPVKIEIVDLSKGGTVQDATPDYIAGKRLVLVYTNLDKAFYGYGDTVETAEKMFDVTDAGYKYVNNNYDTKEFTEDSTAYKHVYGIVVDAVGTFEATEAHEKLYRDKVIFLGSDASFAPENIVYDADINLTKELDVNDYSMNNGIYNDEYERVTYIRSILKADYEHDKIVNTTDSLNVKGVVDTAKTVNQ